VAPDSIVAWSQPNGSSRPIAVRFKWHYQDNRRSGGGRGTVRLSPPDSLRVDWAAVLNARTGAAVVIGDSLRWADPKEDYPSALPQAIQLIWTVLGIVRPPSPGTATFGMRDSTRTVWRYTQDRDTLAFRLTAVPRTLEAEWRRGGKLMARSRTEYGASGLPQRARVDVPQRSARFELSFGVVDTTASLTPALWGSRR
jgi:hypothetical protein